MGPYIVTQSKNILVNHCGSGSSLPAREVLIKCLHHAVHIILIQYHVGQLHDVTEFWQRQVAFACLVKFLESSSQVLPIAR